jgi:hypothetical protein
MKPLWALDDDEIDELIADGELEPSEDMEVTQDMIDAGYEPPEGDYEWSGDLEPEEDDYEWSGDLDPEDDEDCD